MSEMKVQVHVLNCAGRTPHPGGALEAYQNPGSAKNFGHSNKSKITQDIIRILNIIIIKLY